MHIVILVGFFVVVVFVVVVVVVVVVDFKHVKAAWNTLLPLSKFANLFQSQT